MNGVRGRMPLADAVAMAAMLVRSGRAIHPNDWVEWQDRDETDVLAIFGPV